MSKIYILETLDPDERRQVPVVFTTDEDFAKKLRERFLVDISKVREAKDCEFRLEERKFAFYLNKQLDIIDTMDMGLTIYDLYERNYSIRSPGPKGREFIVFIFAKDEDQAKARLKKLLSQKRYKKQFSPSGD